MVTIVFIKEHFLHTNKPWLGMGLNYSPVDQLRKMNELGKVFLHIDIVKWQNLSNYQSKKNLFKYSDFKSTETWILHAKFNICLSMPCFLKDTRAFT